MSFEIPGHKLGVLSAGADLSAAQYTFVKVSSGKIAQCSSSGEAAIGILQNKPPSGQSAEVDRDGVSKLLFAGSVTSGAKVTTTAAGLGIVAASGDYINGIALEDVAAGAYGAVAQRGPGKA